jgi:hypothetical protein
MNTLYLQAKLLQHCQTIVSLPVQDKLPHMHERSSMGGTWRHATAASLGGAAGLMDPSLSPEGLAAACEARRAALLERESTLQVGAALQLQHHT